MTERLPYRLTSIVCGISVLICIAPSLLAQPAQQQIDLVVEGGTAVTMDSERRIIANAAIAIRGDSIVAVGQRDELAARFAPTRRLTAQGKLIIAGLINGHNHAAMTLFRGLGDDLPLEEWLRNYIFQPKLETLTRISSAGALGLPPWKWTLT